MRIKQLILFLLMGSAFFQCGDVLGAHDLEVVRLTESDILKARKEAERIKADYDTFFNEKIKAGKEDLNQNMESFSSFDYKKEKEIKEDADREVEVIRSGKDGKEVAQTKYDKKVKDIKDKYTGSESSEKASYQEALTKADENKAKALKEIERVHQQNVQKALDERDLLFEEIDKKKIQINVDEKIAFEDSKQMYQEQLRTKKITKSRYDQLIDELRKSNKNKSTRNEEKYKSDHAFAESSYRKKVKSFESFRDHSINSENSLCEAIKKNAKVVQDAKIADAAKKRDKDTQDIQTRESRKDVIAANEKAELESSRLKCRDFLRKRVIEAFKNEQKATASSYSKNTLNDFDKKYFNILYKAASTWDIDLFNEAKEVLKEKTITHYRDNKKSILHYACYYGYLPVIRYLIEEKGIPINELDSDKKVPLSYAQDRGFLYETNNKKNDVIAYLKNHGAVLSDSISTKINTVELKAKIKKLEEDIEKQRKIRDVRIQMEKTQGESLAKRVEAKGEIERIAYYNFNNSDLNNNFSSLNELKSANNIIDRNYDRRVARQIEKDTKEALDTEHTETVRLIDLESEYMNSLVILEGKATISADGRGFTFTSLSAIKEYQDKRKEDSSAKRDAKKKLARRKLEIVWKDEGIEFTENQAKIAKMKDEKSTKKQINEKKSATKSELKKLSSSIVKEEQDDFKREDDRLKAKKDAQISVSKRIFNFNKAQLIAKKSSYSWQEFASQMRELELLLKRDTDLADFSYKKISAHTKQQVNRLTESFKKDLEEKQENINKTYNESWSEIKKIVTDNIATLRSRYDIPEPEKDWFVKTFLSIFEALTAPFRRTFWKAGSFGEWWSNNGTFMSTVMTAGMLGPINSIMFTSFNMTVQALPENIGSIWPGIDINKMAGDMLNAFIISPAENATSAGDFFRRFGNVAVAAAEGFADSATGNPAVFTVAIIAGILLDPSGGIASKIASLKGLFSAANNIAQSIGAQVLAQASKPIKQLIKEAAKSALMKIKSFGSAVKKGFKSVVTSAKPAVKSIPLKMKNLWKSGKSLAGKFGRNLLKLPDNIVIYAKKAGSAIKNGILDVPDAIVIYSKRAGRAVKRVFMSTGDDVGSIATKNADDIANIIKKGSNVALQEVVDKVDDVVKAVANGTDDVTKGIIASTRQRIGGLLKNVIEESFDDIQKILAESSEELSGAVLEAIKKKGVDVSSRGASRLIQAKIKTLVGEFVKSHVDDVLGSAKSSIVEQLKTAIGKSVADVDSLFNAIKNHQGSISNVRNGVRFFSNTVIEEATQELAKAMMVSTEKGGRGLVQSFAQQQAHSLMESLVHQMRMAGAEAALNAITAFNTGFTSAMKKAGIVVTKSLIEIAKDAKNATKSVVGTMEDLTKGNVDNIAKTIVNAAGEVGEAIWNQTDEAAKVAANIGDTLASQVDDGAKLAGKVTTQADDAVKAVATKVDDVARVTTGSADNVVTKVDDAAKGTASSVDDIGKGIAKELAPAPVTAVDVPLLRKNISANIQKAVADPDIARIIKADPILGDDMLKELREFDLSAASKESIERVRIALKRAENTKAIAMTNNIPLAEGDIAESLSKVQAMRIKDIKQAITQSRLSDDIDSLLKIDKSIPKSSVDVSRVGIMTESSKDVFNAKEVIQGVDDVKHVSITSTTTTKADDVARVTTGSVDNVVTKVDDGAKVVANVDDVSKNVDTIVKPIVSVEDVKPTSSSIVTKVENVSVSSKPSYNANMSPDELKSLVDESKKLLTKYNKTAVLDFETMTVDDIAKLKKAIAGKNDVKKLNELLEKSVSDIDAVKRQIEKTSSSVHKGVKVNLSADKQRLENFMRTSKELTEKITALNSIDDGVAAALKLKEINALPVKPIIEVPKIVVKDVVPEVSVIPATKVETVLPPVKPVIVVPDIPVVQIAPASVPTPVVSVVPAVQVAPVVEVSKTVFEAVKETVVEAAKKTTTSATKEVVDALGNQMQEVTEAVVGNKPVEPAVKDNAPADVKNSTKVDDAKTEGIEIDNAKKNNLAETYKEYMKQKEKFDNAMKKVKEEQEDEEEGNDGQLKKSFSERVKDLIL